MRISLLTTPLLCGTILLLTSQCQTKVAPPSPRAEGFDPPIPARLSYVSGVISVPLRELEAKINQELDPVLVGKGAGDGQKGGLFPFSVVRSGPVKIRYVNQQITFSAPLQVQLAKPLSNGKSLPEKDPFCAIHVKFMSPLTVTSAWRLSTKIKFAGYEWIKKPQIRLLGKEISLENFIQNLLERHQATIEAMIDAAVYKELRLDRLVGPIWTDMQKPLLINKAYGLWLVPRPVEVAASPIQGDSASIATLIRIALHTQTQLQPQKPVPVPTALPALQLQEQLPLASDLHLLSSIPYSDINRIMDRALRSKDHKLLLGSLNVKKVTVYGGQRSIIIKTDVSGLLNGTLYLRGRPGFDSETNTLHITNLDFDAQTRDALSRFSNATIHDALCRLLESLLTIELGEDIARLPEKIDAAFEKSKAGRKTNLSIQAFRFAPQKIAVRADGIQALINVESKVGLQVEKL